MTKNRTTGIALLLVLLLTGGCSSHNKGKLEGTRWTSLPVTIKGENVPEGNFGLEFGADGSLVYHAQDHTFKGKYSLGNYDWVEFQFDEFVNNLKNHSEKITVDGDTLTMIDGAIEIKYRRATTPGSK